MSSPEFADKRKRHSIQEERTQNFSKIMDNFRTSSVPFHQRHNHHLPFNKQNFNKNVDFNDNNNNNNFNNNNNNDYNNINNKNNIVTPMYTSNAINRINNSIIGSEGYQQSQMMTQLEDIEEVSRTNENLNQNISVVVTIDPNKGGKSAKQIKLAGLSGLVFFVYSAILVTFSINNSIVEVYRNEHTEFIFRTTFSIYIYGVGTILYIIIEIDQYLKKKKKRLSSKKPIIIDENDKIESHRSKSTYYEKENSEKDAKIDYKSSRRKPGLQDNNEEVRGYLKINNTKYIKQSPSIHDLTPDDVFLGDIPKVEEEEEIVEDVFLDLSRLGTIFNHHGSSFFLRIGTLLFGVGHIIYIVFEMMSQIGSGTECTSINHWGSLVVRLIFVIIQMFALFKNPQFIINRKSALWHKASFVHIMTTNACMWINTLTSEIGLETKSFKHNNTYNDSPYSACDLMVSASPYLFPFILEYCLLCVSIVAVLYFSLKEEDKTKVERGISNLFKIDVFEKEKSLDDKSETLSHSGELFSKSHRGIFIGCLFLAANIICIVIFRTMIKVYGSSDHGPNNGAELLFLSEEFVSHFLLLVVAIIALIKIDQLSFIGKPRSIDDMLIYLALTGSLMYNIALMNSAVYVIINDKQYCTKVEVMRILQSLCAIVHQITQVGLVSSGLRRYPSKTSHVVDKPGRTCLTFLVIGNITAWIYHSTLSKSHSLQNTPIKLYGELTWIVLSNITLPLQLFFYFHSSVCLAEIWHTAYHVIEDHSHKNHEGETDSQHTDVPHTPSFVANRRRNSESYGQNIKQISSIIRSVSVSQLNSKPKRPFKDYNDRRRFSSNKHIPANAQLTSIDEYENYSFYM